MDDTTLHAPTLRWAASMLESRAAESEQHGLAETAEEYGAIRAMRLLADGLHERADDLAKEPPPLSAWIAATEGLGEPRIETVRGAMPIFVHLRGALVQLFEPLKPPAFVYTTEGGLSGPTPCASPAELRAALEALVPR